MSNTNGPARLYALAVTRARAPFRNGSGWDVLGLTLQRALIMAEVVAIIAGQDSDAAAPAMLRLAEHALTATSITT